MSFTCKKTHYSPFPVFHRKEIGRILQTATIRAVNQATNMCMPYVTAMVMFTTHYMLGETLTAKKVFSTLALLQVLRFSLAIFLPMAVQTIAEAKVSCTRIQVCSLWVTFTDIEQSDENSLNLPNFTAVEALSSRLFPSISNARSYQSLKLSWLSKFACLSLPVKKLGDSNCLRDLLMHFFHHDILGQELESLKIKVILTLLQKFLELDEMKSENVVSRPLSNDEPKPHVIVNDVKASWRSVSEVGDFIFSCIKPPVRYFEIFFLERS